MVTRHEAATLGVAALLAILGGLGVRTARQAGPSAPDWFTAPAVVFRIDVNSADAPTLGLLPGIGPSKAAEIVGCRLSRGRPFERVEDLDEVKGIGPVLSRRLAPHVRFGPCASAVPTGSPPSPSSPSPR
ncbi:MAG: helix-hairpin-helix domain-containing protein [Planctomycetes bacterium]|nr:helix-hairpin-helix domain-containing protein [Planctomycetota bacterium]